MRICVFGAGAVGGYLAASLARGGAKVSIVARGAHLAAVRARGLTVESDSGAFNEVVAASDNPGDLGPQDAVLVTVKAPSLPSVAAAIAPLLRADTPVAFVMNGIPWWYFHALPGPHTERQLPRLDPDGALWRVVGPQRAVGGIFWPACAVTAPGVIRLVAGAGSGTVFGEPNGMISPRLETIATAFRAADLPVTLSPDIRTLLWRKLAFNLSAGPMCVLTETPVLDTHAEDALIDTSRRVLAEADSLARAMGIDLALDLPAIVAANRKLTHRPSILQDLLAGRRMEIEALYGVPLELARLAGVAMPTLETLAALIRVKARARGLYGG
jgi:2-dehydropantoate 2-reductase